MTQGFTDIVWPVWEVVGKLGEGSFGGVYEIRRTLPDGTVERAALKKLTVPRDPAEIKELYAQNYDSASITEHFKEQMQELVQEYRFMQELSRNSYVVHCQDLRTVHHDDGIGWDIYIQMELLTPLKAWLSERYDERKVVRLGLNLCGALNGCHQRNIIHRDIKPENILVTEDGRFKLGDFGIAKVSEKTATGTLTGTYSYMAPEVANRQHYGASADIYSLGLVMYWMMNERTLPFLPLSKKIPSGLQRQEAQDRRFSGEEIPAPLNGSLELTRIVLKACAFNPEDRYHSVQEMAEDLHNLPRKASTVAPIEGGTTVVEPKQKPLVQPTTESVSSRKPTDITTLILLIAVAFVLIISIIFGVWAVFRELHSEQGSKTPLTTAENGNVDADSEANTTHFLLKRNETGITLLGYEGSIPSELVIPSAIDGTPVTCIGDRAFSDNNTLTSVLIPDSVISIGNSAFSQCDSLVSVMIPDSVILLGDRAFWKCSNIMSIAIPDGVTKIGDWAFRDCVNLNSVVLPDSITSIGDAAFSGCASLCDITIPGRVSNIGNSAFKGCKKLESIVVPEGIHKINTEMFYGCASLSRISIPESVNIIEDYAFFGCSSLSSVTIPSGVHTIGQRAFKGCVSLSSITIPEDVSSIGERAFNDCSSLTSISIPKNITGIPYMAFCGCSSLSSVVFSNSITYIDEWAFGGCERLQTISIPDSVTRISKSAFEGCISLNAISLPSGVSQIDSRAFYSTSLTSVTINKNCVIQADTFPDHCQITYNGNATDVSESNQDVAHKLVQEPDHICPGYLGCFCIENGAKMKLVCMGFGDYERTVDAIPITMLPRENQSISQYPAVGTKNQLIWKMEPYTEQKITLLLGGKTKYYALHAVVAENSRVFLDVVVDGTLLSSGEISDTYLSNAIIGAQELELRLKNENAETSIAIQGCVSLLENPASGGTLLGTGTEETPYCIYTAEDFLKIQEKLDAHYALMQDIEFSSETVVRPMGEGGYRYPNWSSKGGFSGILDGNGHKISGVRIVSPKQCGGLFTSIDETGVVKNLVLDCEISSEVVDMDNALGGITGYNNGTIQNCTVNAVGGTEGIYCMIGCIAGANHGEIMGCKTTGKLSAYGNYAKAGGIVGIQIANARSPLVDCDTEAIRAYSGKIMPLVGYTQS